MSKLLECFPRYSAVRSSPSSHALLKSLFISSISGSLRTVGLVCYPCHPPALPRPSRSSGQCRGWPRSRDLSGPVHVEG